jgi:flagellar biosynthesis protein FliQ
MTLYDALNQGWISSQNAAELGFMLGLAMVVVLMASIIVGLMIAIPIALFSRREKTKNDG